MVETSLSGVLQQAVLRTHLRKQQRKWPDFSSPSPTSKTSSFSSSSSSPSFHLQDHELERPPYGDESSSSPSASSFGDPVLQYISHILEEEDMEDRKCMMQECISYQATVKELYAILRGKSVEASDSDFPSGENENGNEEGEEEEEEEGNGDGDDETQTGKLSADEYDNFRNNGKGHFGFCVDERQVELDLMGKKKKEEEEDWMADLLKSIGEDEYKEKDESREICIPDSFNSSGNSFLLLSRKDNGKLQSVEEVYADRNPGGGIGKQHVACPDVSNTMAIDVPDAIVESFTEMSSGNVVRPSMENQIGDYGSELHGGSEYTIGKPSDEVPPHHGFPKVHGGSEDTIKKPFAKVSSYRGCPTVCDDGCNTIEKPLCMTPQCVCLPNLQNGSDAVESSSSGEIPQGGLHPNLRNGSDTAERPLGKIPHGSYLPNLHGVSDTVEGSSGQIARGGLLPNRHNGSHTSGKASADMAAQSGFLPNLHNGSHSSGKPSADTAAQSGFLISNLHNGSHTSGKPSADMATQNGFLSSLHDGKSSVSDTTEKHFGQRNTKRRNEAGGQAHGHRHRSPTDKGHFDERTGSRRRQDEIVSYVRNGNLDAETCGKVLTKGLAVLSGQNRSMRREEQDRGGGGGGGCSACESGAATRDLKSLLMQAAMAADDIGRAHQILQEIRRHSSPYGNGLQRLAHYFAEGLVARLSSTGGLLYTAFTNNAPSAARMLKAHRLFVEVCPFVKLSHYFANKAILEAARGASKLHIVDYGILYGLQWPCLMSALAERRESGEPLPRLRITGIDFPRPGVKAAERVEMTGRRLAEYARAYDVPFEYHAIAGKWECIGASDLRLDKRELLVVNSIFRLRHLLDETVLASNPRKALLHRIRSLQPTLFVHGVRNGNFNSPFFVPRFHEALSYFECEFDMIDSTIAAENAERMMVEREVLGRDILNVVACEGAERIERPETYGQWENRTRRAGFEPVPLDRCTMHEARTIMKSMYDQRFSLSEDGHWMLLGWKRRPLHALSVWKPATDRR